MQLLGYGPFMMCGLLRCGHAAERRCAHHDNETSTTHRLLRGWSEFACARAVAMAMLFRRSGTMG